MELRLSSASSTFGGRGDIFDQQPRQLQSIGVEIGIDLIANQLAQLLIICRQIQHRDARRPHSARKTADDFIA